VRGLARRVLVLAPVVAGRAVAGGEWPARVSPYSTYCVLCTTYYTGGDLTNLGDYIRARREALRAEDPGYSLRQVAERVGIEPSYLSKVERGLGSPPAEETLLRIARDLALDGDVVLALAGKVSADLRETIRRRPQLFAELIRELKDMPDHAVLRLVREVRDGDW
jgi:transcriptional regulator with XRE-family HTH domain